jgi:hypothetical protein
MIHHHLVAVEGGLHQQVPAIPVALAAGAHYFPAVSEPTLKSEYCL